MKCPKCQTDNISDSKYCKECATPFPAAKDADVSLTQTMIAYKDELTTGSAFAGRYQIIEEIGAGGMGTVYKAMDTEINEKVAVKILRPEISADQRTIERFRNELKITRNISHRNICRMYHLGRDKDTYYIVMEYVSGENLNSLVRRTRQLTVGTAVSIAAQIADGLDEAHKLGIIHRDLKPHNIMIDKEGRAKIMDFGIARSVHVKGVTSDAAIMGTPEYISPEQIEGDEADARSDIYALGLILFEMITGRAPFEGDTPLSVYYKHVNTPPPSPRLLNAQVPEKLNRLILRCLEKNPAKRYQTAAVLHADLAQIEKSTPAPERLVPAIKSTTAKGLPVKFRLRKLRIPALIAVSLLLAGFFVGRVVFKTSASGPPREKFSLAVIAFENQTGDKAYDYLQEAIPNLLITSLEQSQSIRITSWERLRDLGKRLGKDDPRIVDRDLGFELCRRDGIQAIVLGSYVKAGEVFATDAKIYDVATKRLLKSVGSRGDNVDSILKKQIDDISGEIAKGFGDWKGAPKVSPSPITEATTRSLEAYNYFLRGQEEFEKYYFAEARRDLEKAVAIDPEFAMAYSYLVRVYYSLADPEAAQAAIQKLEKYGGRVAGKEGLTIQALLAYYVGHDGEKYFQILKTITEKYPEEKRVRVDLANYYRSHGRFEEAAGELRRALELDPRYGYAMNLLAYNFGDQNKFKEALEYFQLYASISPGDANPYDSMGELYFRLGQMEKARQKFEEAVRIKPDFGSSIRISYIYALQENYEEALKWADRFISAAPSNGHKTAGYQLKAIYHYLFGQFRMCLQELDQARKFSADENDSTSINNIFRAEIWISYDWGRFDLFLKYAKERFDFRAEKKIQTEAYNSELLLFYRGLADVKAGRIEQALSKSSEIEKSRSGEKDAAILSGINNARYFLLSEIYLSQGRADEAISAFKKIEPTPISIGNIYTLLQNNIPLINDIPARAWALAGKKDLAIAEYERLTSPDPQARRQELIHSFSRFRLAKLYEETGQRDKAIAQYEKLTGIWAKADKDLPEVEEARARLAKLKGR